MAEAKFPVPGNGEAFVVAEVCAIFLGVSADTLRRWSAALPWIATSGRGKKLTYSAYDIGFLAEVMRKKVLPEEVFFHRLATAGDRLQPPALAGAGRAKKATEPPG